MDPDVALRLAHESASCIRYSQEKLLADDEGYLLLRFEGMAKPSDALADAEASLGSNPGSAYLCLSSSRFRARLGDAAGANRSRRRAMAIDPSLASGGM